MKRLRVVKTEFIRCLFFWGILGLISCDEVRQEEYVPVNIPPSATYNVGYRVLKVKGYPVYQGRPLSEFQIITNVNQVSFDRNSDWVMVMDDYKRNFVIYPLPYAQQDYDAYKCTTGTCRVFIAPMEQSSGPFNPGNTNTYQQ